MRADLIRRRDAARVRQQAVRAQGKPLTDASVHRELQGVLGELEQIHLETDESTADAGEVAKIYSYMGDVLFELGNYTDAVSLERALRVYDRALALVGNREPQRSKILFNRSNALRGLGGGGNIPRLQQARESYAQALDGFERHAAELVPVAHAALEAVDHQLANLDPDAMLLALIYARYQKDIAAGKVTAERKLILDELFSELFAVAKKSGDATIEQMMERKRKLEELMSRIGVLLATPSGAVAPAGSRAERVTAELEHARRYVLDQQAERFKSSGDTSRLQQLIEQLFVATSNLANAHDDATTRTLERDVLRRLALEIRRLPRRRHLTLARPVWSTDLVGTRTDAVFFSGGGAAKQRLEAATRERGLVLLASADDGADPAESRWRQLRASNIAVFDYTNGATDLASTSYELGVARALGVDVLVLADRSGALPFDIEVRPVLEDEDLGAAIDSALYQPQSAKAGDSSQSFVASVLDAYASVDAPEGRYLLRALAEDPADALRVADLFEQLRNVRRDAYMMLRAAWPSPPLTAERRCFHVMPFAPAWADAARETVATACANAGVTYLRGDAATDARIIHSIWTEICRASHVVVDLTGKNSNVLLELGMAHALGRATLLVCQSQDLARELIPSLSRFRVVGYRADDMIGLRNAANAFVHGP